MLTHLSSAHSCAQSAQAAAAHGRETSTALTADDAILILDAFAHGHELVLAAWEVFEHQEDMHDLLDTLERIVNSDVLKRLSWPQQTSEGAQLAASATAMAMEVRHTTGHNT